VALRYVPAAQALQHGRDDALQAQSLLTGDLARLDQARLLRAQGLLEDAAKDFGERSSALSDGWIGGVAVHLPLIGPQVEAARLLRTAGQDGAQTGSDIVGLVQRLLPSDRSTQPLLQRLVSVAQQRGADLSVLSTHLKALQSDLAALPNGSLLGQLSNARQTLRTQVPKLLSTAGPAITLLEALPPAIGSGTHTYLLLLENPGEMRPGGGYIGAVGQVTFANGALIDQIFRDSTFTDALVKDIPAPRPFNVYLQHGAPWNMADADWSPDYATGVSDIERFYTAATGVHPDGVIAVDPVALGRILSITGPITVPPYPQVITGTNALTELNYITNYARPGDPGKVFLPPFGQAVVGRLLHAGLGEAPAMATELARSADQRHLVLYFADHKLETLVHGAGFDGGVRAPLGDSLQVLDANLSGTKGDLYVTRTFSLAVTVGDDGQAHDKLTLRYRNPLLTTPADQALTQGSGGDYRDYLQMLIPETARVDSLTLSLDGGAPQPLSPENVTYAFHRQDVAYWLIVPRGGSASVVLTYEGPFADISLSPTMYSLSWQRQNGALTWPIDVAVTMPRAKARTWTSDLSVDRSWSLTAG
jgi:hypothetical protein